MPRVGAPPVLALVLALATTLSCGAAPAPRPPGLPAARPTAPGGPAAPGLSVALFAGGCFWSLESALEKEYGVLSATSGYAGGSSRSPTYSNYADAGHVEVVRVVYDPSRVSFEALLDSYWRHTDPTDAGGSFYDRGPEYRPVVFWYDEAQKAAAEASRAALAKSGPFRKPIVTELAPAPDFWPAEDYHQDYAARNPEDYRRYRVGSGRDRFFAATWGPSALVEPGLPPGARGGEWSRPSDEELARTLTPLQFEVIRREGTEPPFRNEYAELHDEGIFVDRVSGEPLFSSRDKYDSLTGWPSFTRPLVPANVIEVPDASLGVLRIEVRSRWADSHLGHVFDDGPAPTGLRYCMNSASLRFVPAAEMEREGYGAYLRYLD